MTSKLTLILLCNVLIYNICQAADLTVEACDAAVLKHQYQAAIVLADAHPKQAEFWLCKGRAQSGLQQNAAAEDSFRQAITLKPQGLSLISAHMLLGNAQQQNKDTAGALASYQQALALSEQQNMRRYIRIAHNLIGETRYEQGDYAASLQAFETGEKLAANDDERADSYVHEAMAYQQLQQLDKAIEYQLKAVMMLRKSGTPDQYAEASLLLGKLFEAKKDYAGADKTYQRLMQYAQENGGSFYEAKTALYWADAKRAQGDAAMAEKLIKQAEGIAAKTPDPELDALLAKAK